MVHVVIFRRAEAFIVVGFILEPQYQRWPVQIPAQSHFMLAAKTE